MKIYSLITICITLGLFYALAVFEQNKKANEKKQEAGIDEMTTYHRNWVCNAKISSNEQSFDMMVSGKEHRYLHTGISFLEYQTDTDRDRNEMNSLLVVRD